MFLFTRLPLILLLCFFTSFGFSQNVDLKSPYQSVFTHLNYLQEDTYDLARAAQPFRANNDSITANRLAIKLKQLWDSKGMYVFVDKVPQTSNYTDSLSNKNIYTVFPKEMPEIYLIKSNENWVYSDLSCLSIPQLHEKSFPFGISRLLSCLPQGITKNILGLQIWQWLGLGLLAFLAFLVQWILGKMVKPLVTNFLSKRLKFQWTDEKTLFKLSRYIAVLLVLQLLQSVLPLLMLPIFFSQKIFLLIYVLKTIVVVALMLKIIDVFMVYLNHLTSKTTSKMDDQLSPIIYRFLQFIVVLFGLIYILQKFEVNVTALFAGLSIGGLALALAAQDTVKNLIGSATIFVDKPFQIGDYISGGGFQGTVLEVGFRTTRLQASDTSIISVPNGTVANLTLTNKGVRVYRLYNTTLGLEYNTPIDKVNEFMDRLKTLILEEDKILNENYIVGLVNLGESTLDILFKFFIDTAAYDEEIQIKSQVNLDVLKIAEEIGVSFAFPSRTIYTSEG